MLSKHFDQFKEKHKNQSKETNGGGLIYYFYCFLNDTQVQSILRIRFYGTGGFYTIYQLIYGRGTWTLKEMFNHFKTSFLLSKPKKPMVNHC